MTDFEKTENCVNNSSASDKNIDGMDLNEEINSDENPVNSKTITQTQLTPYFSEENDDSNNERKPDDVGEHADHDKGSFLSLRDTYVDLKYSNISRDECQTHEYYRLMKNTEDNIESIEIEDKQKIGETVTNLHYTEDIETDKDNMSDEEAETKTSDADSKIFKNIPLFEIIRPKSLKEFIGQTHLINDHNGTIKNFIRLGYLPSMILYGPPGVGKTSIASILAQETGYVFVELSATDASVSGIKELLTTIEKENRKRTKKDVEYLRVVVFIDEIHRFTKVQQDYLLPFIEFGIFTFIGATTLDPEVRIRRSIISRCQVFQLEVLESNEIEQVVRKGILYQNIRRRILRKLRSLSYNDECLNLIIRRCNGDTRAAVNLVELVSTHYSLKDFTYEPGKHESLQLDCDTLKNAIESLKINLSGLQNTKNLNLFLNLYDSMRNVIGKRAVEHLSVSLQKKYLDITSGKGKFDKKNFSCKSTEPNIRQANRGRGGTDNNKLQNLRIETSRTISAEKLKTKANAVIQKLTEESFVVRINFPNRRDETSSTDKEVNKDFERIKEDDSGNYNAEEFAHFQYDILQYNDLEKSYIARIEVSDDSDVEPGPLLSDYEKDEAPIDMENVSLVNYFVLSSIHSILLLLDRGETFSFIGKQLVLFTAVYLKSDNADMGKTMALMKSIRNTNTNILKTLSNCVERLTRAEKLRSTESSNLIQKLKCMKRFCYQESQKLNKEHANKESLYNDDKIEVVYNSQLVQELLNPVQKITDMTINRIFEIESLDKFEDINDESYNYVPRDEIEIGSTDPYSCIDYATVMQTDSSTNDLKEIDAQPVRLDEPNSDNSETNETNFKNTDTQLE